MINTFFEHIFCINLVRRADRRAEAEAEFAKHKLTVEFVDGVDGLELDLPPAYTTEGHLINKGEQGCILSHLKVAQLAKQRGLKNYFVFEDDVQLHDNFNTIFSTYMYQVPPNSHMLYLGGNHIESMNKVADNVYRMRNTFTTHAYGILQSGMYDTLIAKLSCKNSKADIAMAELHHNHNCYVFMPHLAWQRPSFSDILEQHTDYIHLK